jgi:hypothetical protein
MVLFEEVIHHPGPFHGLTIFILVDERMDEALELIRQDFVLDNPNISVMHICTYENYADYLIQCDAKDEELEELIEVVLDKLLKDITFYTEYSISHKNVSTDVLHEALQRKFTGGGG